MTTYTPPSLSVENDWVLVSFGFALLAVRSDVICRSPVRVTYPAWAFLVTNHIRPAESGTTELRMSEVSLMDGARS